MSKYSIKDLWDERYGKREDVYDYAGRLMKKLLVETHTVRINPRLTTFVRWRQEERI